MEITHPPKDKNTNCSCPKCTPEPKSCCNHCGKSEENHEGVGQFCKFIFSYQPSHQAKPEVYSILNNETGEWEKDPNLKPLFPPEKKEGFFSILKSAMNSPAPLVQEKECPNYCDTDCYCTKYRCFIDCAKCFSTPTLTEQKGEWEEELLSKFFVYRLGEQFPDHVGAQNDLINWVAAKKKEWVEEAQEETLEWIREKMENLKGVVSVDNSYNKGYNIALDKILSLLTPPTE